MTREEEIRARLDEATPGPWLIDTDPSTFWTIVDSEGNGIAKLRLGEKGRGLLNESLIVMAPSDIDYLLKENQRLQKALELSTNLHEGRRQTTKHMEELYNKANSENQRLRNVVEVLRDNMVQALAYTAQCPECELLLPSHTEDCELQQAMKRESQ